MEAQDLTKITKRTIVSQVEAYKKPNRVTVFCPLANFNSLNLHLLYR
jgi:hypothetical protein